MTIVYINSWQEIILNATYYQVAAQMLTYLQLGTGTHFASHLATQCNAMQEQTTSLYEHINLHTVC